MKFTRPILAISIVLCVSVFSAAQGPAAQQTPAGRQLAGWLAAYDGTDWDVYLTFLKMNFAIQPRGGFLDPALRDRTGGYDLKKIESESPTEVTGLIQERGADGLARVILEVEPGEPHRILKLEVKLIERPAGFALPHMSDQQLVVAVRKRLEDQTASDRFSGAVFVAKEGKPIFARAYWLADREHKSANALQTQFSLASMNKMFTAVALFSPYPLRGGVTSESATIQPEWPACSLTTVQEQQNGLRGR
jgi:D-alanyl-D-alanine carboxypeptidase